MENSNKNLFDIQKLRHRIIHQMIITKFGTNKERMRIKLLIYYFIFKQSNLIYKSNKKN